MGTLFRYFCLLPRMYLRPQSTMPEMHQVCQVCQLSGTAYQEELN